MERPENPNGPFRDQIAAAKQLLNKRRIGPTAPNGRSASPAMVGKSSPGGSNTLTAKAPNATCPGAIRSSIWTAAWSPLAITGRAESVQGIQGAVDSPASVFSISPSSFQGRLAGRPPLA